MCVSAGYTIYGYKLWDKTSRKINVSIDVKFVEDENTLVKTDEKIIKKSVKENSLEYTQENTSEDEEYREEINRKKLKIMEIYT